MPAKKKAAEIVARIPNANSSQNLIYAQRPAQFDFTAFANDINFYNLQKIFLSFFPNHSCQLHFSIRIEVLDGLLLSI